MTNPLIGMLETDTLDAAGKIVMGPLPGQLWTDIKYFIAVVDGKAGLTGDQKHAAVKAEIKQIMLIDNVTILKELAEGVIGAMLDAAIKIGYLYLQVKLASVVGDAPATEIASTIAAVATKVVDTTVADSLAAPINVTGSAS